jgi:hypothetical protein
MLLGTVPMAINRKQIMPTFIADIVAQWFVLKMPQPVNIMFLKGLLQSIARLLSKVYATSAPALKNRSI